MFNLELDMAKQQYTLEEEVNVFVLVKKRIDDILKRNPNTEKIK